jgi:hypothetical protein
MISTTRIAKPNSLTSLINDQRVSFRGANIETEKIFHK